MSKSEEVTGEVSQSEVPCTSDISLHHVGVIDALIHGRESESDGLTWFSWSDRRLLILPYCAPYVGLVVVILLKYCTAAVRCVHCG